jgi:hypothetical protein
LFVITLGQDRHRNKMRGTQPSLASRIGIYYDHTSVHHGRRNGRNPISSDEESVGEPVEYLRGTTSEEEAVVNEVDMRKGRGAKDDLDNISSGIAAISLSTAPAPVIHVANVLIQPVAKASRPKKRALSPIIPDHVDDFSSSKKARINDDTCSSRMSQASDQMMESTDDDTSSSRMSQESDQMMAMMEPTSQCTCWSLEASTHQPWKQQGLSIQAVCECAQSYCEGFENADPGVRCALIVSSDGVGFWVPFFVLERAR